MSDVANNTTINFNNLQKSGLNQQFQDPKLSQKYSDSIEMDLYLNPQLLGRTQINFAKANTNVVPSRMGSQPKKYLHPSQNSMR